MKIPGTTTVAVLVGVALGALGGHALRAQVPPPAVVVGEIDVENAPAYFKEYVQVAAKAVVDGGGKYIVRNGKGVSLYGDPPKALAIMQFESLAKAQAVFASKATPMPRRSATSMRNSGSVRWRDCSRASRRDASPR